MKKIVLLLLMVLLCFGITQAETALVDRAGNPITLPDSVTSIVSLAPATTQILVDLDLAEKITAVDTYSASSIAQVADLPAFDMMAPDLEQIIALAPDLVLLSDMSLVDGSEAIAQLSALDIVVAHIPSSNSIEDIILDIQFVADVCGVSAQAEALYQPLLDAINTLRTDTDTPIPVYFEIGSSPALYSFGKHTFLHEMIEILGGENIFADMEGWISVSEENIIASAPVIIFTNETWLDDAPAAILARDGWESIPAIANSKVFLIDNDASSQPTHHIILALKQMAEAFASID